MNKSAIYHKSSDNYCYALDNDTLVITLRTGKDITGVKLYYGDPFVNGIMGGNGQLQYSIKRMEYCTELADNTLWTTSIKPDFKRCTYYFEINTTTESIFYFENGFRDTNVCGENERLQFFTFPWINPIDVNTVPSWVNNTIWYQIFPDRFCNGDSSLNPLLTKPWTSSNQSVYPFDFYGGDIPGIISKLDYLHNLGITGIYLTPVCKSRTNHKYDIIDYRHIDPHFGTDEQMRELVDKAHALGMRVMMDGVFNHCSSLFHPWRDVVKKGPKSKYYDWFMINRWPLDKGHHNAEKGNFYSFAFVDQMPKLNTNNPDVIKYFVKVCASWVKNFDIDGIRLDVIDETSHEFCSILRKNLKKIKPDLYILGEIWHDSIQWLRGNELDSVMNYPLKDSINEFWIKNDLQSRSLMYSVNRCYNLYMQQTNSILFNLLDSHDTRRLITTLKSIDKFYQQLAVLFTMPGSVCIYYGTEIALEGDVDPDCRRCMPWHEIESGKFNNRISAVKSLISIRNNHKASSSCTYTFDKNYLDTRIIKYTKYDLPAVDMYDKHNTSNISSITVILNCTNEDMKIGSTGKILFSNLFDNDTLLPNGTIIYAKN